MKKVFITAILVSGLTASLFAFDGTKDKKSNTTYISTLVLSRFSSDFSNAKNVTWSIDANCQKADFVARGVKMTAFYTLSGEYLGVTRDLSYDKIPAAAKADIAKNYKNYNVKEVIELKPSADATAYDPYSSLNANDSVLYFVDLTSEKEEILLRVTPEANVYFFKQVK